MDGGQFRRSLQADPDARVFIDRYGIPSTAHRSSGRWVAHPESTEAGREVDEVRLFEPANWLAWREEQHRVSLAYINSLVTIELAEPLPDSVEVYYGFKIPMEKGPDGQWLSERREAVIKGERVIVVPRDELDRYPGARVLET